MKQLIINTIIIIIFFNNTLLAQVIYNSHSVVYREDFSSNPMFTSLEPEYVFWDSEKQNYYAKVFDVSSGNGNYYALSPVFDTVTGSFKFEFDFNVIKEDWGNYPSVILVNQNGSEWVQRFCYMYANYPGQGFMFYDHFNNEYKMSKNPLQNHWYHIIIEYTEDNNDIKCTIVDMENGLIFYEIVLDNFEIGKGFNQIFVGQKSDPPKYGNWSAMAIDNIVVYSGKVDSNNFDIIGPTNSSTWDIGESRLIKWQPGDIKSPVSIKISYYGLEGFDSNLSETIILKTENDGEFEWQVSGPPSDNCIIRIEPVYDHAKGVNSQQFIIKSPYAIEITGYVWKHFNLEKRSISDNVHNYRSIAYDKKGLKSNINVYISQECGLDGTYQLIEKNIEDDPEKENIKRRFSLDLDLYSPSACNVLKFESADDPSIYGLSHPFIMYKPSSFNIYPPTIQPNKDGTVTVHYHLNFDSDSVFDTLEFDLDGDLIFDIEGSVDDPGTTYHHTHTFQEQRVYYSNFRAIINDQISVDNSVTVDARIGEANIIVMLTDMYSCAPITKSVKILLDDKPLSGPDFDGFYLIDPLMPATYELSVEADGYFPYSRSVLLVKGDNNIDIKLEPFFEVPGYPFITSIRMHVPKGNLLGQEKEVQKPVFLSGVSIQWCRFKPNIIWSANKEIKPWKIKINHPFQGISEIPWEDIEKDGIKFDPAEFKIDDQLCFQAIGVEKSTDRIVKSEIKCADMEIAKYPLNENSMMWKDGKYIGLEDYVLNGVKKSVEPDYDSKNIPFFKGKATGLNIPVEFAREFETNGKGKLSAGIVKEIYKDDESCILGGNKVDIGKEFTFTPHVDVDMEWKNGQWDYSGGFGFKLAGSWGWENIPLYIPPPPAPSLFMNIAASLEIDTKFKFLGVEIPEKYRKDYLPRMDGAFGVKPQLSITGAVGYHNIASVEIIGTIILEWELLVTVDDFKNDKLDFELKSSAALRMFMFNHKIPIASCKWDLLKGTNDCGLRKRLNISNLSPEEFYLIPRDYLNKNYQHIPDLKKRRTKTLSKNSPMETILIENVYPYSDAIIANYNDDEITVLLITDDPKRSSANRTCLMAMNINNQGQITNTIPVLDNGTADFHPSAVTLPDGKILALWNDSKNEQSDDIAFDEMLANVEIASAMFEPYSNIWVSMGRVTDNKILDRKASLYVMPDGKVVAAWISNSLNAYLADKDHPDSVNIATFHDGKWSLPQNIATANGAVLYLAMGYHNDQLLVVWDEDTDGDMSTLEDRELFMCTQTENTWNSPQRLTNDNETDTFPNLLTTSTGNTLLIWGRSGNIVCAENFQLTQTTIIAENIGTTSMSDFKVIPRKPAGASLIWTDVYEKGGSNVFVALYDDHEKLWGATRQLISDIDMEQRLDGIYQKDNMFCLVYNKVRLKEDAEYGLVPDKTDLAMLTFNEGSDIAIENLVFSNATPIPFEKIDLYATVVNSGETVVNNIPVAFLVGDTVVATKEITEPLAPGKQVEISAQCTLPETPGITITVRVDPDHILEDKDLSNNYMSKNAIKPNIMARGTTYEILPNDQMLLKAEILNRGSTDAKQFMITLVKVNNHREEIYQNEFIDGLMISEIQERRWRVPQGEYLLYLDLNDAIKEDDESDNIYGYNTSPMLDEPVFQTPEIFDDYHCKLSIYLPVGYTDVNNISWDLDNDGEFEFQTSENSIDYTFASSGIHDVNATLHRQNGEDIIFKGISIRVYSCDGDFDSNGSINLADIIYGLRIISNDSVSVKSKCCDVDNDQHINLSDIIYTFKLIAGLLQTNETDPPDLNSGLVAWYPFDGDLKDASGNDHNCFTNTDYTLAKGVTGSCIYFDGYYRNYLRVPHRSELNFSNDFSISLWAKIVSNDLPSCILSKGRDDYSHYGIFSAGKLFQLNYEGSYDDTVSVSNPSDLPIEEWFHIVGIADATNKKMKYYLNSQLVDSQDLEKDFSIITTHDLVIGRYDIYNNGDSQGANPFHGFVDELRIYNRTLTDDEIKMLYDIRNK